MLDGGVDGVGSVARVVSVAAVAHVGLVEPLEDAGAARASSMSSKPVTSGSSWSLQMAQAKRPERRCNEDGDGVVRVGAKGRGGGLAPHRGPSYIGARGRFRPAVAEEEARVPSNLSVNVAPALDGRRPVGEATVRWKINATKGADDAFDTAMSDG